VFLSFEVLAIQNEEPVETLRPNGSYEPLRRTIRPWRPKRMRTISIFSVRNTSSKLGSRERDGVPAPGRHSESQDVELLRGDSSAPAARTTAAASRNPLNTRAHVGV